METIEKAALEYAIQRQVDAEELKYIGRYQQSFKAGVEFAQRFIPIEEELPTELENVLFKSEYDGETLYEVGFLFSGKFYVKNKIPTHWRPIELK